jgi:hypothetical protein
VAAYASLARPGMDYSFFEALTRRVDKAAGPEKERLTRVRDQLLQLTQEIDRAAQARVEEATHLLRTLLEAPDLNQALMDNLPRIDDTFLAVLNANLEAAQKGGRADTVERLTQINSAIMELIQASSPPEINLINELLQMESDEAAVNALKQRSSEISQQLIDAMLYLAENLRQGDQPQLADRLDKLRDAALGELMAANWRK